MKKSWQGSTVGSMELKMELVTEMQASLRHTEGVPGRGQGQEASEGKAGKRLWEYSAGGLGLWGAMPHPSPDQTDLELDSH